MIRILTDSTADMNGVEGVDIVPVNYPHLHSNEC